MSGAEQGGAAERAQEVEEERPDELQEEGAEAGSAERWGERRRDARVNRNKGDLSSKAVYVTKKNIPVMSPGVRPKYLYEMMIMIILIIIFIVTFMIFCMIQHVKICSGGILNCFKTIIRNTCL